MTDPHEQALDLQLDALLAEAAGVAPAPDLAERILTAAGARTSRRAMWFAAAVLLLGLGAVGGVAWLRHSGATGAAMPAVQPGAEEPQEPAKARTWLTVISDYSESKVLVVDQGGATVRTIDDVYGAWDARLLDNGNLLVVEFAVSRVREIDPQGKTVWEFEDLKNPYRAQRLPNGNTLIADSFGGRVIEVDRQKKVVWSYAKDVRPFSADRLPNGNTLIANVLKDEVIEVNAAGEIVWRASDLPNVHDASRLANGNTLVTLRQRGIVRELDAKGQTVLELKGLDNPSDAERLPNGNTLVAENHCVREFDPTGKEVAKLKATWAVSVHRYFLPAPQQPPAGK